MSLVYFDASAWCKQLNRAEDHYEDLVAFIESCQHARHHMISNEIIFLEARNMAIHAGIDLLDVEETFELLSVVVNSANLLKQAGSRILPADRHHNQRRLKALDKLHLETALQVRADVFVCYDRQLTQAVRSFGTIEAFSPGVAAAPRRPPPSP